MLPHGKGGGGGGKHSGGGPEADLSAVAQGPDDGGVIEEEGPGEGLALGAQGGPMLQSHVQGMNGILRDL